MPFQFRANWSRLTDATADVFSPMMAYEGLMASFLVASFLGILLFDVSRWAQFFAPPACHRMTILARRASDTLIQRNEPRCQLDKARRHRTRSTNVLPPDRKPTPQARAADIDRGRSPAIPEG